MTVKINKPAVNLREELNELKKPTGVAGEAMLRAETVAEQQALIGVGRKNLIINGGMTVAQRGTSFGSTDNDVYTLDRWKSRRYAANNYYTTQEVGDSGDPFVNYIKVRRNTGDTSGNALSLTQRIEPINFKEYRGRTVTLSFLYRTGATFSPQYLRAGILGSTSGGATLTYWAYNADPIGVNDLEIEPSTVWKQHTITYTIPSNAENLAVAFGVEGPYPWTGTAGSDDSFQIANVQLELGNVATPFEHRSYGEELALCQRYYYLLASGTSQSLPTGSYYSSTLVAATVEFPVTMRSSPTMYNAAGTGYYGIYANNGLDLFNSFTSLGRSHPRGATLDSASVGASGVVGQSGPMTTNNANAYIAFDAEL
jgi:hypothetical protein